MKNAVEQEVADIIRRGHEFFHPGLSLDCVIFGFHDNQLKVLLLKMKHAPGWALPGGFVFKEESVDNAAHRILKDRTGLDHIFLQQFYLFGDPKRSDDKLHQNFYKKDMLLPEGNNWFAQRFITIGYYALVEFSHAVPRPDPLSEACTWWSLQELPELILDHAEILNKALETLRLQLNQQPIGLELLPEKFTMPELQRLYETILGKQLDRRNFQRKMLSYGILERLEERRQGVAHKAPFFYRFNLKKYHRALQEGLHGVW